MCDYGIPDHTHLILIIKIYRSHLMMRIRKDKIGRVVQIQKIAIHSDCYLRVRKTAKISNRYNQVSHQTLLHVVFN